MKGTAYLLQATLIALWWTGMHLSPSIYSAFQFPGIGSQAFNSFLLPDLVVVAFLSVLRAYNQRQELSFVILGGFGFATLYCVNASVLTGGGFLSTTAMLLGLAYNLFLIGEKQLFRKSSTSNLSINTLKTIFQIICVWTLTLFVFPTLILKSFGTTSWSFAETAYVAVPLFVFFSAVGLYSALVMVRNGKGTPLPLDQTQKLVTQGPYRYVRNPMAVAGIGQGFSVAILLESLPIFVYTIIGAILWHFVVKPIEEKDMLERFGSDYRTYKKRVSYWIPTFNGLRKNPKASHLGEE